MEWEPEYIAEFIQWHEDRLAELNYPESIKVELRNSRTKWLSKVKFKEK